MTPTLEESLSTPIIFTKEVDESYLKLEIQKMLLRTEVTREFCAGRLSYSDFLEGIAAGGVDVDSAVSLWSQGFTLV